MLSETLISSIRAQPKTANTAISKDVGIYVHSLHPTHTIKSTFKKSSSSPNSLAVNSTHIFAGQADKATIHVYSRDRANQEAIISFPERIHAVLMLNEGLLAVGTAEGRVILWEACTGRQVITSASHLQPVTCLAGDSQSLISGSDDSNVHVWSVSHMMSTSSSGPYDPERSLSNHNAAITSVALGHGSRTTNICLSASKDNTCIVWNYHAGDLLRTFLLPATPICLSLDPCDRVVYIGFENASIHAVPLYDPLAPINTLYDTSLQSTPVPLTSPPFTGAPQAIEAPLSLALSYDGTSLISGHASGKLLQWSTGPQKFSAELADLNAPITNLALLSPFPPHLPVRAVTVTKPRLAADGKHTVTGQFTTALRTSAFERAVMQPGIPEEMLEEAILEFMAGEGVVSVEEKTAETGGATTSVDAEEVARLKKENEELWAIVNEQRELQKQTWSKYRKVQAGKVES